MVLVSIDKTAKFDCRNRTVNRNRDESKNQAVLWLGFNRVDGVGGRGMVLASPKERDRVTPVFYPAFKSTFDGALIAVLLQKGINPTFPIRN